MAPTTHCSNRWDLQIQICPFEVLGNPAEVYCWPALTQLPVLWQGLNNAVALDFDYRQQMIYWTDVTTQGSMIRRMHINGSDVQVSVADSRAWDVQQRPLWSQHKIIHFICMNVSALKPPHCEAQTQRVYTACSFVRSFIAHHSATRTVWQSTGLEETCTGAIRDGTPSRCQSWMERTGQFWSTAAWGNHVLWLWTYATGETGSTQLWGSGSKSSWIFLAGKVC